MSFEILCGDALDLLRDMPAASVHCCITSPPYWGLRDYGTASWEGGDPACDHKGAPFRTKSRINANCGTGTDSKNADDREPMGQSCSKCGAIRVDQQIGLEPTPAEYIARLLDVFREVRRVLVPDGTLWVNLGDSYNSGAEIGRHEARENPKGIGTTTKFLGEPRQYGKRSSGLKPKDLIGIPWRFAFALQADGWYLRSDIIWAKPNPMPESVTDRPTKAHEYVFLLAKQERYWYDSKAIAEQSNGWNGSSFDDERDLALHPNIGKKPRPSAIRGSFNGKTEAMEDTGQNVFHAVTETRNKRTVWTLSTLPTPEAHFATFPVELPETCLRAGCPEGGTVLDPFAGAGTTGLACLKNGRNFLGIELNQKYIEIARARAAKFYPLLAGVAG